MMKFLRSQSQTVLVVVLGVLGLGFLFYGSAGTNLLNLSGNRATTDFGRIDGEDLNVADLTEAVRNTREAIMMEGRSDQLRGSAAVAEEAWRQLLLLHEADRLHIDIGDRELVDHIHQMALFQKDGAYSPEVYETMMKQLQMILRITADSGGDPVTTTKAIFETVVRNDLRTTAVKKALFSGIRSSTHDVSSEYEKLYGPSTVSVITFDPKAFLATTQVTPAEVAAEYKAHPENPAYRTQEKRKVDYVLLLLSPDQIKLPAAQKAAAKDALGQKALDFALAFQPEPSADGQAAPPIPDFLTEARKRGLNPATTDFFAADTPPANLPPSPAFNNAAFALTKDNTISKVIELENGVAVEHLAEIQPSDLKPLDQVQAVIQKQLQQTKSQQMAQMTARTTAKALQDAVAKGADFKTTAAGMKLKVETLPAFQPFVVLKAAQGDQRQQTIAYAVASLKPGQVSEPVPMRTDNTALIVHLDSRAPADPAGLAEFETRFRQSEDQQLQTLVYEDWANWKSRQPGTHKPPDLDAYAGVE